MGKFTFTWEHAGASEVYVTGTFDRWNKTVQLEKEDGIFKKTVELPKTHTQYKFVVNGDWKINDSARKEDDGHGIINNVLLPEDIVDEPVGTLSSAAPTSTTAALAGAVPKETKPDSPPGAFPETPAAETPSAEPQTFAVNPIPATSGLGNPVHLAPGEKVPDASTLTDNTVQSTVQHDKTPEEATSFGVAPIPASSGLGNPISLAPGEKVPDASTLTSNTVDSTVKTDPASYEKADALPELNFTPQAERDAQGGMFSIPPISGNMIPESSLPMGADAKVEQDTGVTIQSSAPLSSTAALAGAVPLEPRGVPEPVVESIKEANASPEAAANPVAIEEKKGVEEELKQTVQEVPPTTDNSITTQLSDNAKAGAATIAAGATIGAAAVAGATYKAAEAVGLNGSATSSDVPPVVKESQELAHTSPEASANSEAVAEKKEVEQEIKEKISQVNEAGEPAPTLSAATATTAPGTKADESVAQGVPEVVEESLKEAHAPVEASANPVAVQEKSLVEQELLSEVKPTDATGEPAPTAAGLSDEALTDAKPLKSSSEPDALNAPASTPAQPETSKAVESTPTPAADKPSTTEQTEPKVTTGTDTAGTEAKSAAPETPSKADRKDSDVSPKGTPGSQSVASGVDDKKKKRRSFFGKLKDKLSSKH